VQEKTWIVWLALLAAALVLEALSLQLFSVWFALGAAAALIACALGAPVWLQVPLFIVVTAMALLAARPLVKRLRKNATPEEAAQEEV